MRYYCRICDKTINHKAKNKHNKTKRHYFMKNYVTKTYNYNDIVWDDIEQILHENIISLNNKFNEFKVNVSCETKDDIEIRVYKNEHNLSEVIHFYLDGVTLYVHVAGKMICNIIRKNLSSKRGINCAPALKVKKLTIKFVSRYVNMSYRYYMQQPRPMIETKMVKQVKNKSEEEKIIIYNLLTYKYKLISC